MTLHKLDETASFAGRNLDVGDFAEALEERTKLILSDVAGETADEDSGVVGVCKLVHRLRSTVVALRGVAHGVHVAAHRASGLAPSLSTAGHATTTLHASGSSAGLVLGSSGRDAHGTVAAVDTLHLLQSVLLVGFVRETHEAVSARHSRDRICHDLGALAGWVFVLEQGHQDVFVDFRSEVSYEDGMFRSAIILAARGFQSVHGHVREAEQVAYLRSARPPPEAQLSLKGRLELGMMDPLRVKALAAAAGLLKSMKQ